jgi:hypothetical protein
MKYHEWIGLPLDDGWIVKVVFRPDVEDAGLFTHHCIIMHIHVRKGEPVRMMLPEGIAAVVLVLCDGVSEHTPVAMTLAQLPDDDRAIN